MNVNLIILDRSGSMSWGGRMDNAIEGINTLLADGGKNDLVLFYTFNGKGSLEKVTTKRKYRVPYITPGGSTALYDAIKNAIDFIPKFAKKVSITVFTDGEENSSKTSAKEVKKVIASCEEKDWLLVFSGTELNSITDAKKLGFKNTLRAKNDKGIRDTFSYMADVRREYNAGVSSSLAYSSTSTTENIEKT